MQNSSPCLTRRFIALLLLASIVGPRADAGGRDDGASSDRELASLVDAVVEELERREGAPFWASVGRLQALGWDAVPALRSHLSKAGERGRLAASKALLAMESDRDADPESPLVKESLTTLNELALTATASEVRAAAMDLLGTYGDPDDVLVFLKKILTDASEPEIVIPLARTLWNLDHVEEARDRLLRYLKSSNIGVKQEAALTLAAIDYFEGDVREILRALKDEPSPQGRRATELDRVHQLSRELDRNLEGGAAILDGVDARELLSIKEKRIRELETQLRDVESAKTAAGDTASSPGARLLEEIVAEIQRSYVDPDKTARRQLVLNAVKGMVGRLDSFSSFMDPEATKSFSQNISGEYVGIGAQVNKRAGDYLEIVRPIYGGPAHEAGLLSGDRVVEVGGVSTDTVEISGVVEKLKGPADSEVTLRVLRRGWSETRDFVLRRRRVEVPSVHYQLLERGSLGYVQIQQFGDKTTEEFVAALDALEKEEVAGLLIDLRDNPGGFLEAAVKIADQFLGSNNERNLPIVTQKGRGEGVDGDERPTYPDAYSRPAYPLVVLINERSASASEVVSGALQDFGRATLVGRRSFGKGSVQRLYSLSPAANDFLGGEGRLRLTVQYYFLPLGRCIHTIRDPDGRLVERGGVEPDVVAGQSSITESRRVEIEVLRRDDRILTYVDKHFEALASLYEQGDNGKVDGYPEFEKLREELVTTPPPEDVRRIIRFYVRRRLEDRNGREFACDVHEDAQLRRGLVELLKKMGEDPADYPEYARAGDAEETAVSDAESPVDAPGVDPEAPPRRKRSAEGEGAPEEKE